jgi:SEC-C motif-containing protein
MRSRFTAYATGDVAYLLASWHPSTRPGHLEIDPAVHWTRLEIVGTTAGGLLDREGTVAFRAHHERDGRAGVLAETSRFTRDAGRWVYLDAIEASLD